MEVERESVLIPMAHARIKDVRPFLCSAVLSFAFSFIIMDYGPKLVQFRCAK